MKYKTIRDILYDVFTIDEIKIEGLSGFLDATDRISDDRPHPKGMTQHDVDRLTTGDPSIPSEEKEHRFKRLAHEFVKANPKCSIYEGTNELEHCAIRFLYY